MRLLFLGLAAAFLATAVEAAPLEAYGQLPSLEQVSISPDGTKLAYVRQQDEMRVVAFEDLATVKPIGALGIGKQKLRAIGWAGPNHLWVVTSMTSAPVIGNYIFSKQEFYQAQIYSLATRKFEPMPNFDNTPYFVNSIPQFRQVDGKPMLFVEGMILDSGGREVLFQVDVETGRARPVESGAPAGELPINTEWVLDTRGRALARTQYNGKSGEWRLQVRNGEQWRTIDTAVYAISPPELISLGTTPGTVLAAREEESGTVYRLISLADGKWGEVLEVDQVEEFLTDDVSQLLIGVTEGGDERRTRFFDQKDQAAWDRIGRAFKGEAVNLQGWTPDRKMVVVQVQGAKTGNSYMLVDQPRGTAELLGPAYAHLTAADVSQPEWIEYKAADGQRIQGVLTLPKGREAKGLPLVVLPHGGPQAHDELGFDWWSQALASRGYAVLQPNFRGSTGYGSDFIEAGYGQWGRKMQTDVSDGVRHLAKEGLIDPKRVCVVGASYGGYVALAGVTLEQDVYRCAVSVAGVSDLRQMLNWQRNRTGGSDNRSVRYWRRFMGAERGREEILDAYSPTKFAAKATVPVLLIHGRDDTVVPYDQTLRMSRALAAAGRKPELVSLPGEDHWLSRGETRLQMLKATVDFLEKHNPPQ